MTAHPPEIVELLACPFCGGRPYVIEDDSHGACGIGCHCDPEPYVDALVGHLDKAAALWNTRAFAPQPGEVELREALEKISGGFINTDWVMTDPPDWHSAFSQLQAIARAALKQDVKS